MLYAAAGQKIAAVTVATLKKVRNDESFDLFWQKIEKEKFDQPGYKMYGNLEN